MITKNFIEKVCFAFSVLNYKVKGDLDFDKFQTIVNKRLSRCEDLADAKEIVNQIRFCIKRWNKIEKIYSKPKLFDYFKVLRCDEGKYISQLKDKEAFGTYWITNGLTGSLKDIAIASATFDDELFFADIKGKKYKIFEDGEYYLSSSAWSAEKMKLFDKQNKRICDIISTRDGNIILKNNSCNYSIPNCFDDTLIFERKYIESLKSEEDIDVNKAFAAIEWDLTKSNSYFSVAKLQIFEMIDEENDLELFLLFAISVFLSFINKISAERAAMVFICTRHFHYR